MKIEKFDKDNFMQMDSMHDSYATEIKVEDKCLIVVYEKLNESLLSSNGTPYYKDKKVTIVYEFESFCDATVYYGENKYLFIDVLGDMKKFIKIIKGCLLRSNKYAADSFGELTLNYALSKMKNGKYQKYKYWGIEINLDVINVTYTWE